MKRLITTLLMVFFLFPLFTSCSNEPPILQGEWKQNNSGSSSDYQYAYIDDNSIEIFWIGDNGDTKALYWSGTFTSPKTTEEPYQWTSKNNYNKTSSAIMASTDATKIFTYKNNTISYEASIVGVTKTVRLNKVKETVSSNNNTNNDKTITSSMIIGPEQQPAGGLYDHTHYGLYEYYVMINGEYQTVCEIIIRDFTYEATYSEIYNQVELNMVFIIDTIYLNREYTNNFAFNVDYYDKTGVRLYGGTVADTADKDNLIRLKWHRFLAYEDVKNGLEIRFGDYYA